MAAVLGLYQGEIFASGPVKRHPSTSVQGEVHRVSRPHKVEPQPVRVIGAIPSSWSQKAFGRGVSTHYQSYVTRPGEDLSAGH